MAVSTSLVRAKGPISDALVIKDVTFDSSYPTGGEPLTAADLGLKVVKFAFCEIKSVGGTVNVANAFYDIDNAKLKVYDETPAEVANTSSLATLVVRVYAFGW